MALITYTVATQPTGNDGTGTVYYKNGMATTMRGRAYPIISRSGHRNPNLNFITQLSVIWEHLTNSQRIGWGTYAFNSPLINAWGTPRYIRGYAHYMRSNRPRLQRGLPRIDDAPATYGFPPYTKPALALANDNSSMQLVPTGADEWANETGAYMLTWLSLPTSPAKTYAPESYSPFVLFAGLTGSPPGPITQPLFGLPTSPVRVWVRSAVTRADGRYTSRS